jgi:metal-sulfur cluster biosynthetic enzyme
MKVKEDVQVVTNSNLKCTVALSGLYDVVDPEIGLNVVDLGLIYQLNFDEGEKVVHGLMTLTTQFCPMGESIMKNVTASLSRSFPEYRVHVELTFDPPWSAERISAEGMEFLNH